VARLIDRLAALWAAPPTGDVRDEQAFLEVYTDPVVLNGRRARVADLVERYRELHAAFSDLALSLVAETTTAGPDGLAVTAVLRQQGRHTGPLPRPGGLDDLPPTGRRFDVLGIDLLRVSDDGRVADIWVVADELGRLTQLGGL
jgi:SnoaL-like polyketide cyclase